MLPVSELGYQLTSRLISGLVPASRRTPSKPLTQPMVTLVSDDGRLEDYQTLYPILARRAAVASIAVVSAAARGEMNTKIPYMSLGQIHHLQQAGWEVLSHTRTHPDLCKLKGTALEAELQHSRAELSEFGLTVGEALVYPFGRFSLGVLSATSRHYRFALLAGGGINTGRLEPFQIRRVAFDQGTQGFYIEQVEQALRARGWLIFMLHPGLPEFDGLQQRHLAYTLQYIQQRGIPILTLGQALKRLGY